MYVLGSLACVCQTLCILNVVTIVRCCFRLLFLRYIHALYFGQHDNLPLYCAQAMNCLVENNNQRH